MSFSAVAYDAGSEGNNEDCDFIPGPCAMGSTNFRYEMGAEGYVYVHNGVHGIGMGAVNLDPSAHDWRNPVARIKVMRIDLTRRNGVLRNSLSVNPKRTPRADAGDRP